MRTFPPRISSGRGGFTFVEVMVALAILTLMTLFVLPAFQSLLQGQREREIGRLASVIRLVRHEAILTRTPYRLTFNLDEGSYAVGKRNEAGEFAAVADVRALAPHQLPDELRLQDVMLYGNVNNRLTNQEVPIAFDPSGFMDPFLLHFQDGGEDWTFRVSFMGRSDALEGYSDEPLR